MASKTAQEADAAERASYRTGPNVDNGLEPGAVTVDPETAAGIAAQQNRKTNGAKETMTEEGVLEVRAKGDDRSPRHESDTAVADPDAPAVDKKSAVAKAKNPNTIANTPDDIVADPKADIQ